MAVYDAFYHFATPPFSLSPDPAFLFLSRRHREALAGLKYAILDGKGFAVLTGEVGTGKTTLVHALLTELGSAVRTALFVNPHLSQQDMYQHLLAEFRLPAEQTMMAATRALQGFLLEQFAAGTRVVVILDEAHALPRRILEEVRLLSNFETSRNKLLQILLVGQPELVPRLRKPALRQLRQRIALGFELLPLDFEETAAYVRTRVAAAGGAEHLFEPAAFVALYRFSGGLPRLLNLLCDHALVKSFARDCHTVGARVVRDAAHDLNLQPVGRVGVWRRLAMRRRLRAAAAKVTGGRAEVGVPFVEVTR